MVRTPKVGRGNERFVLAVLGTARAVEAVGLEAVGQA